MESHENEHHYVGLPLTEVAHATIEDSVVSHEEICEPVDECILPDNLVTVDVSDDIAEAQVAVEILTSQSDDETDDKSMIYPIYIKQEEHHQYTSGDDESMAVEALRQLGGMYPCFEDKKVQCPKCSMCMTQSELTVHRETCSSEGKMSCSTCSEKFERKQDLNNHIVCHQVDRPHACRICGNLFRSKANLQTHMTQVHRAEKPHKCEICGADFHRPSSLSNHMKIHSYVAGRALMQTSTNVQTENRRKWPDDSTASGSFDVQWSVPYSFADQTNADNTDKMDTMQEFAVIPNGEVTQFEYTQDPLAQFNITTTYPQNTEVKVEGLTFTQDTPVNYPETQESIKSHVCSHCSASFVRATALVSHEKIHAPTKTWTMPIECEYCDKQFQDANHLSSHQTTCAKKLMQTNADQGNGKWGKHACTECGKKFTTKQKMFRHQWIHRKKTHCCEICGTQFERQNQLDEHRLAAHPGDSPFTCTECGKSFVSRQGLWEHGRTHAGSPAHFHCDTCSKTFSSRQGYLIHHRTHTGERPYGCKFCWKAFRDGGTLRKHERIHTGERPHVCPLCSRAFNQKVVLREHVRWVHAAGKNETEVSGPPYSCPLCGALNQDRDELCAHIVKHSDQMIAEAKAKTNNNAPATAKAGRKKPRATSTSSSTKIAPRVEQITRNEETVALLSITTSQEDGEGDGSATVVDDRGCTTEMEGNEVEYVAMNEGIDVVREIEQSDVNVLHLIGEAKRETLRLIATGKSKNTLHLITKRNESLPVLAIRNHEQSHENFSSQINDDAHASRRNITVCLSNQQETSQVSVEQVAQYLQDGRRESDDEDDEDEEMVCGICGDDFDDKNVLMEHVKIHI